MKTTHILRTEWRRLFGGIGWKLAVLLALVIAVWEFVAVVLPASPYNEAYVLNGDMPLPYHLWGNWLGGEMISLPSYLYRLLLPVLATLPFAASYASDMNGGYARQLVSRAKKQSYLKAKIFTVWFGGGLASVLPLVFNFALATMVMPLRGPNRTLNGAAFPGSKQIIGELFGETPFVYYTLWLMILFAFCGAMALVALFFSLYVKNTFIIWITPFTVYLCTNVIARRLVPENADAFLPMQYLHPMQGAFPPSSALILFTELAILLLFGVAFYAIAVRRDTI